ncbi:MAG: DUF3576 domain-containing protein [Rhodospirillales bacterium]|jgi:hypothetical protein|nr:DUF3576 domain-containing protein [Rhodospirillales bacterium]
MKRLITKLALLAAALAVVGVTASCSGVKTERTTQESIETVEEKRKRAGGKLFGDDALTLGGPERPADGAGGGGIGVNSYLWRASLDTVLFMPVNSADPFGGVIITDWHTPQDAPPEERFKLNIYILGRALRADGVRVAVFRQVKDGPSWRDARVSGDVGTKIEDAILMKARQLRHETLDQ